MADPSSFLPPTTVPVLDDDNALTLPWRRALQTLGNQSAAGITALTGDVTATGPGTAVAELAATGVTAGSYVNADVTVDTKGRITSISDGSTTADPDPLTLAAVSLLDGALTVSAAYKLAHARSFTYTGDLTGGPTSFDGSANVSTALTLASTAVTPGTYGDATHVGQFTVDAKGRITAASNVAISGGGGAGSWFPLTNGVEPPAFISDGAGVPIAVAYTP